MPDPLVPDLSRSLGLRRIHYFYTGGLSPRWSHILAAVLTASTPLAAPLPRAATQTTPAATTPHVASSAAAVANRGFRNQAEIVRGHRPWVWKATRGSQTIYFVGCLHVGTSEDTALYAAYLPFYNRCDTVYFETLPGIWTSYSTAKMLTRRGYFTARQSLRQHVQPETWQAVTDYITRNGGRPPNISQMKPWLAGLEIIRQQYEVTGHSANYSLETFITNAAHRDRKPVGGIEKPEEQIDGLASLPLERQEEFLAGALESASQTQADMLRLRTAWRSGNQAALVAALRKPDGPPTIFDKVIIEDRNRRWVKMIDKGKLSGDVIMIVVGIEHIVTPHHGLPGLLREEGFTIE